MAMDTTTESRAPVTISVPGYDPERHHSALIRRIHATYGPDARLWSVDPAAAEAVVGWGPPPVRPGEVVATLSSDVRPTQAAEVEARVRSTRPDLTLVDWRPEEGVAIFARLDPETHRIRQRIAEFFNAADRPWAVELALEWVWDEAEGAARIEAVHIERTPAITPLERRRTVLAEIATEVVGGPGWTVEDDPRTIQAVLRWGRPPVLPRLVGSGTLVPAVYPDPDSADWPRLLPLGVDTRGEVAGLDLAAGPHALVVGPTGSGKTIALRSLAVGALLRGFDLVLMDSMKGAVDFRELVPYAAAVGREIPTVAEAMQQLYEEVGRRKHLLLDRLPPGADGHWSALPADVRRAENVRPLLAVVDEFGSTVATSPVPKNLPKDHPLRQEAEAENVAKEVISVLTGKLAREARFVGIHLAIALQRPDTSIMGGSGELRSNLSSRVQLVSPSTPPSGDALRMIFPPDDAHVAEEVIEQLNDGSSPGLGLVQAEGGAVAGVRVAYTPGEEVAQLMEAAGVEPVASQWDLTPRADDYDPAPVRSGGRSKPRPAAPSVADLFEEG